VAHLIDKGHAERLQILTIARELVAAGQPPSTLRIAERLGTTTGRVDNAVRTIRKHPERYPDGWPKAPAGAARPKHRPRTPEEVAEINDLGERFLANANRALKLLGELALDLGLVTASWNVTPSSSAEFVATELAWPIPADLLATLGGPGAWEPYPEVDPPAVAQSPAPAVPEPTPCPAASPPPPPSAATSAMESPSAPETARVTAPAPKAAKRPSKPPKPRRPTGNRSSARPAGPAQGPTPEGSPGSSVASTPVGGVIPGEVPERESVGLAPVDSPPVEPEATNPQPTIPAREPSPADAARMARIREYRRIAAEGTDISSRVLTLAWGIREGMGRFPTDLDLARKLNISMKEVGEIAESWSEKGAWIGPRKVSRPVAELGIEPRR